MLVPRAAMTKKTIVCNIADYRATRCGRWTDRHKEREAARKGMSRVWSGRKNWSGAGAEAAEVGSRVRKDLPEQGQCRRLSTVASHLVQPWATSSTRPILLSSSGAWPTPLATDIFAVFLRRFPTTSRYPATSDSSLVPRRRSLLLPRSHPPCGSSFLRCRCRCRLRRLLRLSQASART